MEPPNITCPGNVTAYTDAGKSYATIVLPREESSVDNSGFIPTIDVIVEDMMYGVGDNVLFNLSMSPYVVQYLATDNSTNNVTCDFNITVIGRLLTKHSIPPINHDREINKCVGSLVILN